MELNLTKPLIILDLETTGINVATDRIIEICFLKVFPDQSTEILTEHINPTIPIPPKSTAIHGISDEDVRSKPTFAQRAGKLLQFIGNADLAGYNALKFDIPLLVEEFLRVGVDFEIKNRKLIDVQNIFHKMEPRNLAAAYRFYCNQELVNAHRAEADTRATFDILKAQLDKYHQVPYPGSEDTSDFPVKNDIASLSDFSSQTKNADLVGHIIFDEKDREVFNFGKYKGKPVEKVFTDEPQYYDWMMKAQFPLYTKKVITAIYLRGFNKSSVNLK